MTGIVTALGRESRKYRGGRRVHRRGCRVLEIPFTFSSLFSSSFAPYLVLVIDRSGWLPRHSCVSVSPESMSATIPISALLSPVRCLGGRTLRTVRESLSPFFVLNHERASPSMLTSRVEGMLIGD